MRLVDHLADRFARLCDAARFEPAPIVRTFRDLVSPWAEAPVGTSSGWVSDISDDNTPVTAPSAWKTRVIALSCRVAAGILSLIFRQCPAP